MHKKLITTCMAIAAFAAFVVAPAASAANFTEDGVTLGAGASFTGETNFARFIAANNTVTCSRAHISGTVTADANGTIAAEIPALTPIFTGTGNGEDCTSNGLGAVRVTVSSKLCLHFPKGVHIGTVTGCAGATVTFTLHVTTLGIICHYEKASIGIEITTAPADAQVKIRPGEILKKEAPDSFLCPPELEPEMEFTLTTTNGTTLLFS